MSSYPTSALFSSDIASSRSSPSLSTRTQLVLLLAPSRTPHTFFLLSLDSIAGTITLLQTLMATEPSTTLPHVTLHRLASRASALVFHGTSSRPTASLVTTLSWHPYLPPSTPPLLPSSVLVQPLFPPTSLSTTVLTRKSSSMLISLSTSILTSRP